MEISINTAQTHSETATPVVTELAILLQADSRAVRVSELDDGDDPPLYQVIIPAEGGTVILTVEDEELRALGDCLTTGVFDA